MNDLYDVLQYAVLILLMAGLIWSGGN
jgi:hypothetical protein